MFSGTTEVVAFQHAQRRRGRALPKSTWSPARSNPEPPQKFFNRRFRGRGDGQCDQLRTFSPGNGKLTVIRVPLPGALSALMVPP